MTLKRAAAYLDMPESRLYRLRDAGRIPCRKQDGRLIFNRDELDRWLNEFYLGPEELRPSC